MNTAHGAQTFPELAEADAPPEIAAIYAEIRRLAGVPIPALIFRHLATFPGVLEEVWAALGPLFGTGRLQEVAWRIAAEHTRDALVPPIEPAARAVLGLEGETLRMALDTFDSYNRANPVNLMSTLCLVSRMRDALSPALPLDARPWTPPAPPAGPLPPMTAPADMTPQVRRLVQELGSGDRTQPDLVVPSLLRHFAERPAFLALVHVVLRPKFRDGTLAVAVDSLRSAMQIEAASLARHLAPLPLLGRTSGAHPALEHFSTQLIPQMIVVGMGLRGALE